MTNSVVYFKVCPPPKKKKKWVQRWKGKIKKRQEKYQAKSLEKKTYIVVFLSQYNYFKVVRKNLPEFWFRFSPNFADSFCPRRIILHNP